MSSLKRRLTFSLSKSDRLRYLGEKLPVENIAELDNNAAFSHEEAASLLALQQRLQGRQTAVQLPARQLARPGRTERLHTHAQQQVEAGPVYRFWSCAKAVLKAVQI